ncbi:hypothetical protein FIBSPDRAFT_856299 [Athelia psychrophila]|uniref:Uncharacterized protein n=1 Tax=Athelia psychrophila TaxID=1759441 RepID=A0A166NFE2_9AGAM|nr:hypothetical protein FIBSPDRAFT_856299 [Fibularhizoctonia sp. CBS 109695]
MMQRLKHNTPATTQPLAMMFTPLNPSSSPYSAPRAHAQALHALDSTKNQAHGTLDNAKSRYADVKCVAADKVQSARYEVTCTG